MRRTTIIIYNAGFAETLRQLGYSPVTVRPHYGSTAFVYDRPKRVRTLYLAYVKGELELPL